VRSRGGGTTLRRRTVCVRGRARRRLKARLDPTFSQDPANPLHVTYIYGALAQETLGPLSREAPSLPHGLLNFYSDGLLECSTAVGGTRSGSTCTVTYTAFGDHEVIVTYSAGRTSATETTVERIEPFSTHTSLKLSPPTGCTKLAGTVSREACTYVAEVTTLDQNGHPPPAGEQALAFDKLPEQEFTPALDPGKLGLTGSAFGGPLTFILERTHEEAGWQCILRSGSFVEYFGWGRAPIAPLGFECGTSVWVYAAYSGEVPLARWLGSKSPEVPVEF
jgi:hypothetical protein